MWPNASSKTLPMVEEASRQIRTISHLLHPPLLDEAGLASALHWYVEGFSERSKIDAKLDIPESLEGLSKETELSIFRVVQECLTNIHRHAGSPTAAIRIAKDEACLRVEIEDAGKGISSRKAVRVQSVGSGWSWPSRNARTLAAVRWHSAHSLEWPRNPCDGVLPVATGCDCPWAQGIRSRAILTTTLCRRTGAFAQLPCSRSLSEPLSGWNSSLLFSSLPICFLYRSSHRQQIRVAWRKHVMLHEPEGLVG